jgi:hypothetical protein
MKSRITLYIILLICTVNFPLFSMAQSLPVGTSVLEDAYRRGQLLGHVDSTISFTSRPFFPEASLKLKSGFDPYNTLDGRKDGKYHFLGKWGEAKLLPVIWQQQFNTDHPYSLNDGEMIPARGYQTMFSTGIYAKLGPLSIQLQPEYVYAENRAFEGYSEKQSDISWAGYYNFLNRIDLPERFGDKAYSRLFWGQSSIRLTAGPVSFGLSNENLWWGPGIRNSLLMSNTSGGFVHYTLNSVRPIKTPIGSFEGQIIGGRLDGSGFAPPDTNRIWPNTNVKLYIPKRDDWRYLNGMIISYNPKWVPGLFIGITRSFMIYHKDMGNFPVISPTDKKNQNGGNEIPQGGDQLMSSFIRWVLPKEHAEIYFEYGREDHSYNYRDFILEPDYARAYIFGFRKLFPLIAHPDQCIQFHLEVTQLEQNRTNTQRDYIYFYADPNITSGHGYTNRGQLIGAGIGPGSDMQSINISWIKSLKMIGLQIDRYVHNNDFQYNDVKDIRSNWVDLGLALLGEWDYKNLLFTANAELIRSMNYEHLYNPVPGNTNFWAPGQDIYNFQAKLGVMYRF